MASRMERYQEEDKHLPKRRLEKNEGIYKDFYSNTAYTEFTKVESEEVVELSTLDNAAKNREDFRRQKEFLNILVQEEKKNPEMIPPVEETEKIYDINSVLEEAKKRRESKDELERKRKLRNTEYNILEGLNKEKLEELKERRKEGMKDEEEPNLEELIHTITSNSIGKKIKKKDVEEDDQKDLLSDLMPESMEETIITEAISKEILEDYRGEVENEKEEIDHSFYTRSMDLTDQDFEIEDTSFMEAKPQKKFLKVLFILLVLVIIGVVAFIVYDKIK